MKKIYTDEYKSRRLQNLLDEGFDLVTSVAILSTEIKDKHLEVELNLCWGVRFLIARI